MFRADSVRSGFGAGLGVLILAALLLRIGHRPVPSAEVVWEGPEGLKGCAVAHTPEGWLATVYQKGGTTSEVWLNGEKLGAFRYETVGRPERLDDGWLYFPVEHGQNQGRRLLRYREGVLEFHGQTHGPWSVLVADGLAAYNQQAKGRMLDHPVFYDVRTGERKFDLPVKAMPRALVRFDGETWISSNYGESGEDYGIVRLESGEKIAHPATLMCVYRGQLIATGDGFTSPSKNLDQGNGRLYRWHPRKKKFKAWADTGAAMIHDLQVIGDHLVVCTYMPNQLGIVTPNGRWRVLRQGWDPEQNGRHLTSFGNAVAEGDGAWWWLESTISAARLWRVTVDP